MSKKFKLFLGYGFALALLLGSGFAQARQFDNALLVTFGRDASIEEGDSDHGQVIFIRVPESEQRPLHLRLFDPDVGGAFDELLGEWNTTTRFRLYGGAINIEPRIERHKDEVIIENGELLAEAIYGEDPLLDGQWSNFATFRAEQGLLQGKERLFKLVVEGMAGDDGNVFDLAVSLDPRRNIPPPGLLLYSYVPTVHVPQGSKRFAEARFFVPDGMSRIQIHNFDMDHASVWFETPFRRLGSVHSSGRGVWVVDQVELAPWEQGTENAISIATLAHSFNDATFYVKGGDDKLLPLQLPFRIMPENNRPQPKITTTILKDCRTVVYDASATTDADDDDLTFHWTFGDETASGNPISHRYPASGEQSAWLVVRDNSGVIGNSARKEVRITLNQPPVAQLQVPDRAAPGERLTFDGSASHDPDGTIRQYLWDFGDGNRGEGAVVQHRYTRPGFYRVELRVRDDSDSPCNIDSSEAHVWINAAPQVVAGPDRRASIDQTLTLQPQRVFDADSTLEAFHWNFGDGQQAEGREVQHAWAKPGKYQVTLTVDDGSGTSNSSASDSFTVLINDPPQPDAGPDHRVAVGDRVPFNAARSRNPDGKIIDYQWDFGDGHRASGIEASHAYQEPGVYTVTLTVQDDSGTDSDTRSDQASVIVNHPPVAIAGPDQQLHRSEVAFDGSASSDRDGEITAYNWTFGDGRSGSGVTPQHYYGNPGRYLVELTVTDDSATASQHHQDQLEVVINAAPLADPGATVYAAPGQPIRFDGSHSLDPDGEISGYQWDFGDGQPAVNQAVVEHRYQQPGSYQARLRVSDHSGHPEAVDEAAVAVIINHPPVARIHAPRWVAPGDPVHFDGSASSDPDGEIASWHWHFSDHHEVIREPRATRTFEQPGSYYATLTVDDGRGLPNSQHQTRALVRINHRPQAVPQSEYHPCDSSVLFDASASLDGDGDPLHYHWAFGDGQQGEGMRIMHHYKTGGIYPVVLTVDDGRGLANSRHSAALTVTLNQPPVAIADEDITACAGEIITFNAARSSDPKGGFLQYRWWFGDGNHGEGVNPTHSYRLGGRYPVRLQVEDDSGLHCGQAQDQLLVRVAESPIARAGEDREVCAHREIQFDGTASQDPNGLIHNYDWEFGDGTSGGGATPTHLYSQPGDYLARLTISGERVGSCPHRDSDTVRIRVHAAPQAVIHAPSAAAEGESITFDGSASLGMGLTVSNWQWDLGDGSQASGPQIEHHFSEAGKYLVTLQVTVEGDSECGHNTTSHLITVNAAPVADAGAARSGAAHEAILFDASASYDPDGAIVNYFWAFGDGTQAEGIQQRHRYREPGEYLVTLRVEDDAAQSNSVTATTLPVTINHPPQPQIEAPAVACVGQVIPFDGSGSHDPDGNLIDYRWWFGDGLSASGPQVEHHYLQPGRYAVALEVSDDSATSSARASAWHPLQINQPPQPIADLPAFACPDSEIPFSAHRSYDEEGEIVEYLWAFGDGQQGHGVATTHRYPEPGNYRVRLTVDDGSGSSCARSHQELTLPIRTPLRANAGEDREVWVGGAHDTLWLTASEEGRGEGQGVLFHWDLGDGNTRHGQRIAHRYSEPGEYRVTLTVEDGSGLPCGRASDQITVTARSRTAK